MDWLKTGNWMTVYDRQVRHKRGNRGETEERKREKKTRWRHKLDGGQEQVNEMRSWEFFITQNARRSSSLDLRHRWSFWFFLTINSVLFYEHSFFNPFDDYYSSSSYQNYVLGVVTTTAAKPSAVPKTSKSLRFCEQAYLWRRDKKTYTTSTLIVITLIVVPLIVISLVVVISLSTVTLTVVSLTLIAVRGSELWKALAREYMLDIRWMGIHRHSHRESHVEQQGQLRADGSQRCWLSRADKPPLAIHW